MIALRNWRRSVGGEWRIGVRVRFRPIADISERRDASSVRFLVPSIALVATLWLEGSAVAQSDFEGRVKLAGQVRELAFNPESFFRDEYNSQPVVTVTYTGDDYAWPVYSIAVFEGCHDDEPRVDACRSALRARMVRSPSAPDMRRPRERGGRLVWKLYEEGKTSRMALRSALTRAGVEWKEADIRRCPSAMKVMEKSANLNWVPTEISNPTPKDEISIVLHADIVEVTFRQYGRTSIYSGYIADGSPAAWAEDFAESLEPCWANATTPPPWQR